MIKFSTEIRGEPLYGLVIMPENIKRLKEGKPILVDLMELGGKGKVAIHYAESVEQAKADLAPFIGPETKVKNRL